MNLDHSEVPFEVWCDFLEDDRISTDELRLLFAMALPHVGDDGGAEETTPCDDQYGDGYACWYELENTYGDGGVVSRRVPQGNGAVTETGDGVAFMYDLGCIL